VLRGRARSETTNPVRHSRGLWDCIKILDLEGRLHFMSEGGLRAMEIDDFATVKGCSWQEF